MIIKEWHTQFLSPPSLCCIALIGVLVTVDFQSPKTANSMESTYWTEVK